MLLRVLLTPVLIALVFVKAAQALNIAVDPSIATATAIVPGAIIESDLKPKVWSVHPTVGYFSGSTNVDGLGSYATSHGYGGTIEAEYSMSNHMGISFSGLGYSGSGDYTPDASVGGSAGSNTINGWLAGASLVLDPFSGDGFRMPFFFGLNYEHVASHMPSSGIVTSMTLNSPGYTLGFSPRFNIAFLRIEPFLVATSPTSKGNVTCSASVVAGACGAQAVQFLPVFGVNFVFRPWNLGFYLNLSSDLFGTGVSYYALGPQLTF